MRNFTKCIARGLRCYAGTKLTVCSDRIEINSARVDERGNVIVEFASLEDLQEWNRDNHWMPYYDGFRVLKDHNFDIRRKTLFDTENFAACYECGEVHRIEDMTEADGEMVCEQCLEDSYFYCEHCNEYHHNCNAVKMHTSTYSSTDDPYYVCDDCATEIGHCCNDCGEWYEDDCCRLGADDEWYCEDCWDNTFTYCDECGEVIYQSDEVYDEDSDRVLCQSCYDDLHHGGTIRSYHHNPSLVFNNAGDDDNLTDKYIGTEVETECGDVKDRVEITADHGDNERYIYQMHDGSLDSTGIECITQPMTKAFWDAFDFEGWMSDLSDAGARSHDTNDCGLHVHLSRAWMDTTDTDEQAVFVGRMRQFIADNQQQVERFARRTANHWCEYTKSLYDEEKTTCDKDERLNKHKACGKRGGRYQSVNNENYATIEFRIFRGTLNAETYRASVEFCLRLVDYVTTHEEGTENWEDFVTYKPLPDTMQAYMTRRKMLPAQSM